MTLIALDITAIIISAIGAIVSLGTVALTLIINKKVDAVHRDVNGKMEKLLEASKSASLATGKLEGLAAGNPDLKDLSKETAAGHLIEKGVTVDVKIVDQDKPVTVTQAPKSSEKK